LGDIYLAKGENTKAIESYRKALEINPNLSQAWNGLGEIYYQQGQFPLSLEAHLHACKTDKDSKQRVKDLLKNNRYAVTEEGEILDKESLLLLYDKQRRKAIDDMIAACGLRLQRVKPAGAIPCGCPYCKISKKSWFTTIKLRKFWSFKLFQPKHPLGKLKHNHHNVHNWFYQENHYDHQMSA